MKLNLNISRMGFFGGRGINTNSKQYKTYKKTGVTTASTKQDSLNGYLYNKLF